MMTCHQSQSMNQRRTQLREAKQRQRERDRAAGLVLYQAKLPADLARRLQAGMKIPEFRDRLKAFLHTEMVQIEKYPQLKQLCWNLKVEFLTRADAFALYERNWRLIDHQALEPDEQTLINGLVEEVGKGVVNA